jgi:hypothetical protein
VLEHQHRGRIDDGDQRDEEQPQGDPAAVGPRIRPEALEDLTYGDGRGGLDEAAPIPTGQDSEGALGAVGSLGSDVADDSELVLVPLAAGVSWRRPRLPLRRRVRLPAIR